ncbi:uncharacterized protein GGS25DRAFT_468779 [Hypoxylon fragiforme]|uniref:uncharacterized protein n=1 Tax=Hypoxylon fragiforme TaxID=63214 RepID=UPI0020C66237|nr:uncharacterized protein GGS25DRAFT_468779 [Hypoxylon fragiforme]KAI2613756.1 hypothetical protein GGS25DRAFT_468779 [Hypoxylon fragiforme]
MLSSYPRPYSWLVEVCSQSSSSLCPPIPFRSQSQPLKLKMRFSVLAFVGMAAIALAAPIEVSSELSSRQYEPIYKIHKDLEGATEKRQYRPTYKIHADLEGAVEKRQYEPTYKIHKSLEGAVEERQYRPTYKIHKDLEGAVEKRQYMPGTLSPINLIRTPNCRVK